jgi:hypothetical protein
MKEEARATMTSTELEKLTNDALEALESACRAESERRLAEALAADETELNDEPVGHDDVSDSQPDDEDAPAQARDWKPRAARSLEAARRVVKQLTDYGRLLRSTELAPVQDLELVERRIAAAELALSGDSPRAERLRFLEHLDNVVFRNVQNQVWQALAREHAGLPLSDSEQAHLRTDDSMHRLARDQWREEEMAEHAEYFCKQRLRLRDAQYLQSQLQLNEWARVPSASKLKTSDFEAALGAWQGLAPRGAKWKTLVEILDRMGLGPIAPESLKADWAAHRRKG